MLHTRGYNRLHTSKQLGHIVMAYDSDLESMGDILYGIINESYNMPQRKENYESEDEYRKECMSLVDEAEKAYDEIQNMVPSQALINRLNLKNNSCNVSIEPQMGILPPPLFLTPTKTNPSSEKPQSLR